MAKPAFLEAFEVVEGGASEAPSDDWIAGHAAGIAEAIASSQSDQSALSNDLVQALADMSFGYQEALSHMAQSLEPLFRQLIEKFVPGFAQEMLVPVICNALIEAARSEISAPIRLAVSSSQHDAVAKALGRITDLPFSLRADPTLTSGQAALHSGAGETLIDLDALMSQSQGILSALFDTQTQRSDHG